MSEEKGFSLARLALFFTAATGVAIGTKWLLGGDKDKDRAQALPKPERKSATIIPFRPRMK